MKTFEDFERFLGGLKQQRDELKLKLHLLKADVRDEWEKDVHESAILKKKSLGRERYLTDFEAQFEVANNPNVDSEIRSMSLNRLLPEIIACVRSQGLSAQRYIGEITSTSQAITNGGLSLRNIRNKAGILRAYIVTAHQQALSEVLDRHRIHCQVIKNRFMQTVMSRRLAVANLPDQVGKKESSLNPAFLAEREIALHCHPSDLWIDVAQPFGKLALILLEPLSSSSLFRAPPYSETLEPGKEFFIYRVDGS